MTFVSRCRRCHLLAQNLVFSERYIEQLGPNDTNPNESSDRKNSTGLRPKHVSDWFALN